MDFVEIPAEKMQKYFNDAKETYIYISHQHIIDIFLITFKSRLNSEYEIKEPIDNDIFTQILSKIQNSDNLSERFKNEFFDFIIKYFFMQHCRTI
jgi:low temperature requirement protein LtrA